MEKRRGARKKIVKQNKGKGQKIDLSALQFIENNYVIVAEETYNPPTTSLDENGQGIPYAVFV